MLIPIAEAPQKKRTEEFCGPATAAQVRGWVGTCLMQLERRGSRFFNRDWPEEALSRIFHGLQQYLKDVAAGWTLQCIQASV